MSKLILGTVQFGLNYGINNVNGQTAEEEAFQILDFAYQNGIKRLDTAANYGNAEEVLGKYFTKHPSKKFEIITKFNLINRTCEESLKSSIDKLQVESVNSMMFHSFSDYQKSKSQIQELNRNCKGKLFKNLGVSVYTNDQLKSVIEDPEIDLIQAPFNLLDNENLRGELFLKIKEAGKELHTRSVFLQGLFFKDINLFPEKLKSLLPSIQLLKDLANKNHISLNDMAIAYVFSKKYIDGVLFGVDSLEQMKQNVISSSTVLSEETIHQIDAIKISNVDLLNPSLW
ncbi:aldo/keto reductase [Cytophagaceae bacterium 50C-KIRBA]|uniref:Aldo/keto reductase n=1 Tax=Aquirufa beregesia TaxID=2516556 RepID=A0ABX0EUN1_9BACT|nr:aldo/keto reductase [Aquirufa beregesia]NGZ43768.1 aldo/keto reductase [Aquirufa beregesia]